VKPFEGLDYISSFLLWLSRFFWLVCGWPLTQPLGALLLIFGIILLAFSAEKAVEHSVKIASALGMSPLMIGL
jgi:hypothetical protein